GLPRRSVTLELEVDAIVVVADDGLHNAKPAHRSGRPLPGTSVRIRRSAAPSPPRPRPDLPTTLLNTDGAPKSRNSHRGPRFAGGARRIERLDRAPRTARLTAPAPGIGQPVGAMLRIAVRMESRSTAAPSAVTR